MRSAGHHGRDTNGITMLTIITTRGTYLVSGNANTRKIPVFHRVQAESVFPFAGKYRHRDRTHPSRFELS